MATVYFPAGHTQITDCDSLAGPDATKNADITVIEDDHLEITYSGGDAYNASASYFLTV
jgi:hypothetical protein